MTDIPSLAFVAPEQAHDTYNILLYGPPGCGKTTGACSAPGPVLVLNAEGPNALRYSRRVYGNQHIREVRFDDASTLGEVAGYLRDGGDGVKTVVVDSLAAIYRKLLESIGGAKPQIQHYGQVNTLIQRFVLALRDMPFNVVLVAHEKIDDQGDDRIVRPLTGGQQLPEIVMGEVDVVAYCGVDQRDKDNTRYVAQLVQDRGRRAKDRTGALGRARDINVTEWIEAARSAMQAADADLPWAGVDADAADVPVDPDSVDQLDLEPAA